jgi:hypothetical protein
MPDDHPALSTDNAFCLGCGYPLRRLESNRCPECGRAFDPADARTMSIGGPLRRWQRWLLWPLGWPLLALVLLGTAGFIYLGGRPYIFPEPWSVLRDEFRWPRQSLRPFTAPDIVFYVSVCLWAAFLFLFSLRQVARILIPIEARRGSVFASRVRRWNRLVAVAAVLSACWLIFGWQHRIGRRWVVKVVKTAPTSPAPFNMPYYIWPDPPVPLSPEQASLVLGDAIVHLPDAHDRMVVLKLLVETKGKSGKAAIEGLVRIAERADDPALLAWDLRLIGLCRDPSTESLLTRCLEDPRPQVRAAAADAIGILRHPSYSVGLPDGGYLVEPLALVSTPSIAVGGLVSVPEEKYFSPSGYVEHDLLDDPPIAVDRSVRPILQRMMTRGQTPEEREAAARALVDWPPESFRFRVAEWGVWINNNGQMALARSIVDEIWQSLIICPERAPWMAPPAIPNDPRFRWWARLREVPSSWVASRGEAERFLYYDGPTKSMVPVSVTLESAGSRLGFKAMPRGTEEIGREQYPKHRLEPLHATQAANLPPREGLYIEVHAGVIRGQHMAVDESTPVSLKSDLPLHGEAVVQQRRTMLTTYGLTAPEAEGLIAAWTPQFFQTEGRRFLLRMSAADYDWQCPMQVRPKPTELIRLGLVLTEFDAKPDTRPAAGGAPSAK